MVFPKMPQDYQARYQNEDWTWETALQCSLLGLPDIDGELC